MDLHCPDMTLEDRVKEVLKDDDVLWSSSHVKEVLRDLWGVYLIYKMQHVNERDLLGG